jgi:hypothetical protein
LEKKIQVLIASRPISTGVDGLQHICNRLIINTLPWVSKQYMSKAELEKDKSKNTICSWVQ